MIKIDKKKKEDIKAFLLKNKEVVYLASGLLLVAIGHQIGFTDGFDSGVAAVGGHAEPYQFWVNIPPIKVALSFAIIAWGIGNIFRVRFG